MAAEWIDRMRGVDVGPVAAALGCAVKPSGSSITVSPCPSCKAERRRERRGEKRGPVSFRKSNPAGWKCHACDVTGDALHFVALSLAGRKLGELDDADRARVREWCVAYTGGGEYSTREYKTPSEYKSEPRLPEYPPVDELRTVWQGLSLALTSLPALQVTGWLERERGLDAARVAELDLARAHIELPKTVPAPAWTCFESGASYHARGFRLVVPMYDAIGEMRSLIFRRVVSRAEGPKSLPPRGFDRTGLVMADPLALEMLRGLNELWAPLVIAEGEMSFLRWATRSSSACATLGIVSGSWTTEIAARIPDGTRVVIATDHDEAGIGYATRIIATLADRARAGALKLERWKGARAS
jgi:hypothetical protein